ncbi:MAG: ABC transporter permease, partial [Longimicrobiales bacterium]
PVDARDEIAGDLEELFRRRCETDGVGRARLWYWREAISFVARFLLERILERRQLKREHSDMSAPGGARARRAAVVPAISWLDIKLGLRMLIKYPALSLIGLIAMSVTIAIAAAIFEFGNDILHAELPLEDGDRIVGIRNYDVAAADPELQSLHDFMKWRDELNAVEDIGAFIRLERNLITGDGRPEPVDVAEISASAFRVARVPPVMGRSLVDTDEQDGAAPVVVIGYDVWQDRFGGGDDVIGRTLQLGGSTQTVVGVMPDGFTFPQSHGLWLLLRRNALDYDRGDGPSLWVFGRLAPGVTLEDA